MIDIVIVNWNSGKLIQSCIESINKNHDGVIKNIIVVDNGSTDGSDSYLENFLSVKLIRAKSNLGFAKACNLGAQYTTNEFILFLNPDTVIYPDTFLRVLNFMSQPKQRTYGICGIQLIDEDKKVLQHCSRIPTANSLIFHALGLDRVFPRLGYVMGEWDHLTTQEVDHVIGAFYFVRRLVFERLNGFDERFFVYLEDIDFSLRAQKLGWGCIYFSDAQAHHLCGGSSRKIKSKRLFYSVRSRLLYAYKHFSLFNSLKISIITMTVEPLTRVIWAARLMSFESLKESIIAYGYLLIWIYKKFKFKFKGMS